MPCYTSWDAHLEEGTPEYLRVRAAVERSLASAKHVVDYYLVALQIDPSLAAKYLADENPAEKVPKRLTKCIEMTAHHLNCDGINFIGVYDICTLLSSTDERSRLYSLVLNHCAIAMRRDKEAFPTVAKRAQPPDGQPDTGAPS